MPNTPGWQGFRAMLSNFFRTAVEDEGVSGDQLRSQLWAALYAIEPAFWGIEDYYPDSQTVIYVTSPNDTLQWWRRSYQVAESGEVSVGEEREEVQPTRTYETLAAGTANVTADTANLAANSAESEPETVVTSTCSCQTHTAQANTEEETPTMPLAKKDLVAKIIAAKRSPFKETDTKLLEGMNDEQLDNLNRTYAEDAQTPTQEPAQTPTQTPPQSPTQPAQEPVTNPTPQRNPNTTPTPAPANADEVRLSREDYANMRAAADAFARQQQERKNSLISSIVAAQGEFTQADLAGWSIESLEKQVRVCNANRPRDYSGQTFVAPLDNQQNDYPDPPSTYDIKGLQEAYRKKHGI